MLSAEDTPRPAPLRLLYLCTALLVLVLLATNGVVIYQLRESELQDEDHQLQNLSLTLAEQAARSFQPVDLVVQGVVAELADDGSDDASFIRRLAGEDMHHYLAAKLGGIPQLSAVSVIGPNGKLATFSRAWPAPPIDVTDRDYFQALRDDPKRGSYISEPVQNRANGAWTIFLARRLSGKDGRFRGIVIGAMEMRYFDDFYRAISLGEDTTIAIQRLDGVLLTRFPWTDAIGKTFSPAQRLLQGGVGGSLHERSPIDGKMRLKAAHLVTGFPAVAVATRTEEAALGNWRDIARLMWLGAAVCAASIAVAGFALGRQWKQQSMLAHAQAELRHQEDRTTAIAAAKEAAEAADRAKSEFLATMSHELRTPLNAVLGFSEVMMDEVYGPLGNERYRDYAQDIHASGNHLLSIVNDVLDLSKAAAGKLKLVEDWIDAREAVEAVGRLIAPRSNAGKLNLAVKVPPETVFIYADGRLLKQMLLNLLSNACKFTAPGGRVECALAIDEAGILFSVSDTGVGIPSEYLERVMLPFVQVDSSLSRRHDGTGLGLALVKAMAELHGGHLRLVSDVGSGTTATVVLPPTRLRLAQERATETALSREPA